MQKILHGSLAGCEARRPQTATIAFYHVVRYVRHDSVVKFYDWRLAHEDGGVKHEAAGIGGAYAAAIISARSFRISLKGHNVFADVFLYPS